MGTFLDSLITWLRPFFQRSGLWKTDFRSVILLCFVLITFRLGPLLLDICFMGTTESHDQKPW